MAGSAASPLKIWHLTPHGVEPEEGAGERQPVGSLQKLWVVKAWAEEHGEEHTLPAFVCPGGASCWFRAGHGRLSLRRATAVSCNSYFRALAQAVTPAGLSRMFEEAGFQLPSGLDPDRAIGLGPFEDLPRISPGDLLNGYRELLAQPWPNRDDVRTAFLEGMAESAATGTGRGLTRPGWLSKTGTVGLREGFVIGWTLFSDPSWQEVALARLEGATGAQTANEVALSSNSAPGIGAGLPAAVTVRVFSSLSPSRLIARNLGAEPVSMERGTESSWVGTGADRVLEPGDRLSNSTWEILVEPYRLHRIFKGEFEVQGSHSRMIAVLKTPLRDYAEGILRAEMRNGSKEMQVELAATTLRFLARGSRHGNIAVCDLSHCAWFLGLGPDVRWISKTNPVETPESLPAVFLDDEAWQAVLQLGSKPGPSSWSAHCGGEPLSEWAVWGHGSRRVWPCGRHRPGNASYRWQRLLGQAELNAVFKGRVLDMVPVDTRGYKRTQIQLEGRTLRLSYDELQRSLAPEFGWGAIPSPPVRIQKTKAGFLFSGTGSGHKVGLCLAG